MLSEFPDPTARGAREPGPLRVLFVGGDFRRKGGDLLIKVAQSLRGQVELHLVTSADVASGDGVRVYKGLKPLSPELIDCYRRADVFALPTRGDCLAVVLGEAMASSLPIITTRVGAHAEAVEDGHSGFLIDMDDEGALRDRLQRLSADPELARRLGKRSREVGEERFNMQRNAEQIAELLRGLAAQARTGEL
jgi:glycosyltransferase involved in cell wall biosynthesis